MYNEQKQDDVSVRTNVAPHQLDESMEKEFQDAIQRLEKATNNLSDTDSEIVAYRNFRLVRAEELAIETTRLNFF